LWPLPEFWGLIALHHGVYTNRCTPQEMVFHLVAFSRNTDLDKQTANPLFTALKNARFRVAAKKCRAFIYDFENNLTQIIVKGFKLVEISNDRILRLILK
jgi:hypothetical protein